jgi:hypothetical protein
MIPNKVGIALHRTNHLRLLLAWHECNILIKRLDLKVSGGKNLQNLYLGLFASDFIFKLWAFDAFRVNSIKMVCGGIKKNVSPGKHA